MSELYVPLYLSLVTIFKLQNLHSRSIAHSSIHLTDVALKQLSRSRTLATVTDDPLSQKVEMTNWEKVNTSQGNKLSSSMRSNPMQQTDAI